MPSEPRKLDFRRHFHHGLFGGFAAVDNFHTGRNQAADVGNIGGHNQRIAFFGKIVERSDVLFRNLQIDRIRTALGLKGGGNLTDGFGIGFGNKAQGFRFTFGAVDAGDFLGI